MPNTETAGNKHWFLSGRFTLQLLGSCCLNSAILGKWKLRENDSEQWV